MARGNHVRGPRRYMTHTKLGQILNQRGIPKWKFDAACGIHPRVTTEYLSGRVRPTDANLRAMAACLSVPEADLLEREYPWTADRPTHPALRPDLPYSRANAK